MLFQMQIKDYKIFIYYTGTPHLEKVMITFIDFVQKHNLKNKATSNLKLQQVLSSFGLKDVGIYLRDGPFKNDIGKVNLHPSKGTHCVC